MLHRFLSVAHAGARQEMLACRQSSRHDRPLHLVANGQGG
jgi:hypothetical protein